jgi:hypothetical protein
VIGDVPGDEDGIKCCATVFAEIGEQSVPNLYVAIKLGSGVGGGNVEVGKMKKG